MQKSKRLGKTFVLISSLVFVFAGHTFANQRIYLNLENAVNIALSSSHRIKQLELSIQRTKHWLDARQASLKSRVDMYLKLPDIQSISDYKWNSTLRMDEIVRQNTQLWQSELSIKQPVVFLGYPTNGYVSLNYKIYQYKQRDESDENTTFYNRLYMKYEQPLFSINELKNNLERAELDLKENQLRYIRDKVNILDDVADDYYDIFELAYRNKIYAQQLTLLEEIQYFVDEIATTDSSYNVDKMQITLENANIKENLLENKSRLRMSLANMKQRLGLDSNDSLIVNPVVHISPISVNLDDAIASGLQLSPQLRMFEIDKRQAEIGVEYQKAQEAFKVNLEMTYGLEKQNEDFQTIWAQYDNSNSVTLNAYIPLWDWGLRRARIQAEQVNVEKSKLRIEEQNEEIKKRITNSHTNLIEYQQRAINMQEGVQMAKSLCEISIRKFMDRSISLQDLLQVIARYSETEKKFIETYLGYRNALLNLMVNTYFDYEKGKSLLELYDFDSHS